MVPAPKCLLYKPSSLEVIYTEVSCPPGVSTFSITRSDMTFLKKSLFLVLFLGLVSLSIGEEEEKREEEDEDEEEYDEEKRADSAYWDKVGKLATLGMGK
ncbi:dermaseptin-A4-like [Engystomops pustulosus]|uniref:dermaseptin-A4-like n=1 Tax=Engystomops pustulosus TaxID=76066 RepID=UPI003AFA9A1F